MADAYAYACRLVAYEPGGAEIGFLPEPSQFSASFVRNAVGSMTLQYAEGAERGDLLARGLGTGLEVGVEVGHTFHGWREPRSARFLLIGRGRSQLDPTRTAKATMPSYGWLLSKARDLNLTEMIGAGLSNEGQRHWVGSPGDIMATLLAENASRDGIPIAANFSGATPTPSPNDGINFWSDLGPDLDVHYDTGIDLLSVLNNLVERRACDWATEGRQLNLYAPGPYAGDEAVAGKLQLNPRDLMEAPEEDSIADLVTRYLVRSDGGVAEIEEDVVAPDPWGKWEGYRSQTGLTSAGATALADGELVANARVKGQYTYRFLVDGGGLLPLIDFEPGQFVTAPTIDGPVAMLVHQVTLTKDADGLTVTLVLNDRFVEAELRRARNIANILGGIAR